MFPISRFVPTSKVYISLVVYAMHSPLFHVLFEFKCKIYHFIATLEYCIKVRSVCISLLGVGAVDTPKLRTPVRREDELLGLGL